MSTRFISGYRQPRLDSFVSFRREGSLDRVRTACVELSWHHALVFVHQLQHLATARARELVAQGEGARPLAPERQRWWSR